MNHAIEPTIVQDVRSITEQTLCFPTTLKTRTHNSAVPGSNLPTQGGEGGNKMRIEYDTLEMINLNAVFDTGWVKCDSVKNN